jgi:NTP pyrophosphatase (non-canonical NTP hydrolase)
MTTITEIFEVYLQKNWAPTATPKDLTVMGMGLCGEAGEASDHFKKVIRDYNSDFNSYPPDKWWEAKLEYGDALHYLLKQAHQFGFTLEELMTANMDKLDARHKRPSWRDPYRYDKSVNK